MLRWFRLIIPVLAALFLSIIAVNYFSTVTIPMPPFNTEVSLRIGFREGGTQIELPLVGAIEAQTHRGPVSFYIQLNAVDFQALQDLLNQEKPQELLVTNLRAQSPEILRFLLRHLLIVSAIGGALGYLLLGPRRWRSIVVGSLIGLVFASGLVYSVYHEFDLAALEKPRFTGAMEYAPWMISFVQRSLDDIEEWGEKLGLMAGSIQKLSQQAQAASALLRAEELQPTDLVILHVSDIHNNPASYRMVQGIIEQFPVDLVVDSGDISDFGSAPEAEQLQAIADLPVPYLWVAGNHDSPEIIRAMRKLPNVQILDGTLAIKGLQIAGWPDPAAVSNEINSSLEELDDFADDIILKLEEAEADVVIVHNHRVAEKLLGKAPVILTGHSHQPDWKEENLSVLSNAGSTGAEGLRGLQKKENSPYTAVLLYFKLTEENRYYLAFLDYLELSADGTGFSLDRKAPKGNSSSMPNSTDNRGQS